MMPLELVNPGDWADVAAINGEPSWIGRMAELGVRIGSRLQVLQSGSPCLLKIGDSRLSLRPALGTEILVQPVGKGT